MNELSQTKVISASVEFFDQKFRTPMQISSGIIDTITEARATVRVKVGSQEATGIGSIYLSDLWAWPDHTLSHEERDAVLRRICLGVAGSLADLCGKPAHPLELALRLHDSSALDGCGVPALALAMCIAPFDAAIHDAAGHATGRSAFTFYDEAVAIPTADHYFPEGAGEAIRKILRSPAESLEGWWIANAHDDLDGDLADAVRRRGFGSVKVKLLGRDLEEDVRRTVAVFHAMRRHGREHPRLSVDSNEGHASADAVLEYLEKLAATDLAAFDALMYLEQPTSRDIRKNRFDWREVAALKPVMLDEGLSSLDLLPLAVEQGWSGLALKTCKGHSFVLVAAAWAREHGLQLTMQDLTNPGYAAIHSFLMAAHLPVLNGIELNSPQFTPRANEPWLPRLANLFEGCDGRHRLSTATAGLGSRI